MALTINLWPENGEDIQHIFPEGTPEENGEILDLFLELSEKAPVKKAKEYPMLYYPYQVEYSGMSFILHVGFIMEVYRADN